MSTLNYYLLVDRDMDGEVELVPFLVADDCKRADFGNLEIIDITNPANPRYYYKGKWYPIERRV